MCCSCMKYETKILVSCRPLNNWWQLSSETHNSFAPLTVITFSLPKWTFNYREYLSPLNCSEMLRTVKWFPLSHLRGGSISAQVKEIQVHTRMFPSSTGLASIWLAAVLSGIAVASSILCNSSKEEALLKFAHHSPFWGPAEECSLFAPAGRALGRRRAVWNDSIWTSWTEVYELGFLWPQFWI